MVCKAAEKKDFNSENMFFLLFASPLAPNKRTRSIAFQERGFLI